MVALVPKQPGPPKGSGGYRKLSPQDRAEIAEKRAAGATLAELGRQYDVSPAAIRYTPKSKADAANDY